MNYVLFIIFVLGSFAMADEGILGIVRIKNTQPVKYDTSTGKIIPDSQNTILRIHDVSFDENFPGKVALLASKGDKYDALLVVFDDSDKNNIVPQKFGYYLAQNKGFQIDVTEDELEFDSTTFLSILKIDAEDLKLRQKNRPTAISLQNVICPMSTGFSWRAPWEKDTPQRADCL